MVVVGREQGKGVGRAAPDNVTAARRSESLGFTPTGDTDTKDTGDTDAENTGDTEDDEVVATVRAPLG